MSFNFQTDDETLALLEVTRDFLVQYFNHTLRHAEGLIDTFYEENRARVPAHFYHHESSFRVAVMIHYFVHLKLKDEGFGDWMRANQFVETPREALEYFNEKYFSPKGR